MAFVRIYILIFILSLQYVMCQNPELTLQTGHSAPVTVMTFSSDGKYMASAGDDNIIIIWDFRQGKQLKILKGHHNRINDLQFLNKNYTLVSAGDDGKLILWDIYTGTIRQEIILENIVLSFDIDRNDSLLIASGAFPDIKCWFIRDSLVFYKNIAVWENMDESKITNAVLKKRHLKSTGRATRNVSHILTGMFKPEQSVSSVVFGQNSSEIYLVRSIIFFADKYIISNFDFKKMGLDGNDLLTKNLSCSFLYKSKGENNIYISGIPSKIKKYNCSEDKVLFSCPGDLLRCNFQSISVNSNDSLLAAVNEDGYVYLWKTNGHYIRVFHKSSSNYKSVCFHPLYSNYLITGNDKGVIEVIDVNSGEIVRILESGILPIKNLSVNPAGNIIATGNSNSWINCMTMNNRVSTGGFVGHKDKISGLYFISDSVLVSSGGDNKIAFHNISSGEKDKIKGNSNPAILNAFINAPLYSVFISTITSFDFAKKYLLGNSESLDVSSISDNGDLFAAGGSGFNRGLLYSVFYPRIFPVHVVDTREMKKVYKFGAHYLSVNSIDFNRNNELIATSGRDYRRLNNWNNESALANSAINMLIPVTGKFSSLKSSFSLQSLYNPYYSVKIWERGRKIPEKTFEIPSEVRSLLFSPVNDSLVFSDVKGNIVLLDYKNNFAKKIIRGNGPLMFYPDGKSIFYQDSTHSLIKYDIENNKKLISYKGHSDSLSAVTLTSDNKYIITTSLDGSMKIWDANTGKEIATVFSMNSNDFIIKTPDYYYYATKNAKKEIGFTFGVKFYPFEQYDMHYNRPDIVMERLNCASPEMIKALNLAYKKRLQKSGFSEDMFSNDFHLPEIEIVDIDKIPVSVSSSLLSLTVGAKDEKYPLDRINLWVNDVALYGANGLSLRNKNKYTHLQNINVTLSHGINKIRVSCLNEKGVESLRETVEIYYTPDHSDKPDLYIISIGASEYTDKEWNLNYAAKDAQDVADMFESEKNRFNKIKTTVLINENVTREKILGIRQSLMSTHVDDQVVVFYAGHGLLDENFDYYLATSNIDFSNPSSGGLSYDELNFLLDSIPAREKILFIDACHSGEFDKEETLITQLVPDNKEVVFRGAKPRGFQSGSTISYNNSFELMKELFSDLRKGTGAMVISSAGGGEFAFEGAQWKNGVFTWSLRDGLMSAHADLNKDKFITVSELQNYVLNNVSKLTDGMQKPTMRQENIDNDFVIWETK